GREPADESAFAVVGQRRVAVEDRGCDGEAAPLEIAVDNLPPPRAVQDALDCSPATLRRHWLLALHGRRPRTGPDDAVDLLARLRVAPAMKLLDNQEPDAGTALVTKIGAATVLVVEAETILAAAE